MAAADTVIRGGTVVTAQSSFRGDVAITDGVITAVGTGSSIAAGEREIDATGKLVFPGAIDCHVHLNLDGWALGSRMAARSGLTTLIPFVGYEASREEALPEAIARIKDEIRGALVTDVSLNFILFNTPYIYRELPRAVELGVAAYKVFMTYKSGPMMSPDGNILRAMETIAGAGGLLQLHCENGEVLDYLHERAIEEGRTSPGDYPATCPPWAEVSPVGGGDPPGDRDGTLGRLPDLRGPPQYRRGPPPRDRSPGMWTARLDRDLSTLPPPG